MRSTRSRALLLAPLALGVVLSARAQESSPLVFTLEDREVGDALDRARTLELQGSWAPAGEEYAKLAILLEKKREKDPDQRIVVKLSPGVDRGVAFALRDRVRALPEEGRAAFRALLEPRARVSLEEALENEDRDALEATAERYALTPSGLRAVQIGADLAF